MYRMNYHQKSKDIIIERYQKNFIFEPDDIPVRDTEFLSNFQENRPDGSDVERKPNQKNPKCSDLLSELLSPPKQTSQMRSKMENLQTSPMLSIMETKKTNAMRPTIENQQTSAFRPILKNQQTSGMPPILEIQQTSAMLPIMENQQTSAMLPIMENQQTSAMLPIMDNQQTSALRPNMQNQQTSVLRSIMENQSNNSGGTGQNSGGAGVSQTNDANNLSDFLYNLWKNQSMCDMVIHLNGKDLMIHKIALAAHSEKFANLYCERIPAVMSEINLSNSTLDAAEEIMRFVYTYEINITPQNIDSLIVCSKQLGITEVYLRCKNYMKNFYHENVLFYLMIAERHEMDDLVAILEYYISENFGTICKSPMFLGLSIEHVKFVLNKDNIRIDSELEIFYAAVSWIDHNRQDRMQYVVELMECVRFVYIPPDDIVNHVEPYTHVFAVQQCKSMLYNAFRYQALMHSGSSLISSIRIPNRRRYGRVQKHKEQRNGNNSLKTTTQSVASSTNRIILGSQSQAQGNVTAHKAPPTKYNLNAPTQLATTGNPPSLSLPPKPSTFVVIGGINPLSIDSDISCRLVEQFNPKTNSWRLLTSLPVPRHHLGAALLDGCLYVVGGSVLNVNDPGNLANPTDVCFRFEPVGAYWTRIASLKKSRMYLGVAVLDGVLYAVGGSDTYGSSLASVEYYNPDIDVWGIVEPMKESKIGAAAIGYHGNLYVIGGYREIQNKKTVLDTVECYDPRRNTWITKNPVPVPCSHANVVEVKDVLYLIGGSTFTTDSVNVRSLSTVFRYSESHDQWELFEHMNIPRHDAGASVIGSKIFIVGGVSSVEGRTLSEVECLDVETRTWIDTIDPLSHPAIGLGCCTFPGD